MVLLLEIWRRQILYLLLLLLLKTRWHTAAEKTSNKIRKKAVTLDLVCIVRHYILTTEKAMAGCTAGNMASGHPCVCRV